MRWPASHRGSRHVADKSAPQDSGWSIIKFVVTVALLAWVLRSFIVALFNIPSGSMLPTLYIGDYVAVAKWPYGYSRYSFPFGYPSFEGRLFSHLPKRGDVVVFRHPADDEDLIKRVIGLPGDVVAVRNGILFLNGHAVPRRPIPPFRMPVSENSPCKVVPPAVPVVSTAGGHSYCVYRAFEETLPGRDSYTVLDQVDEGPADDFPAQRVPAGHLFLMGDNRDDSLDSRFPTAIGGVAMVPIENLIGRATVTVWSTNGSAVYWKPWTWFSALRARRIGNGYSEAAQ
ncbi:MAG TPA: signal peptidase I [Sphingomicrobium sp.]|nr:signal peptidase I [Sphingomicrobium sp.]